MRLEGTGERPHVHVQFLVRIRGEKGLSDHTRHPFDSPKCRWFRYQDVPCQDQCRVVINWPGAPCDYIHANYVGTPLSDKRFICTQVILLHSVCFQEAAFWISLASLRVGQLSCDFHRLILPTASLHVSIHFRWAALFRINLYDDLSR